MSDNITWHEGDVTREDRCDVIGHENKIFWLTGLSGSGKSTIAHELEKRLMQDGKLAYVLDGDNVRHGLNQDLGFTSEERDENIRRVAEVAKLMYEAGIIVIVSFISPYRKMREFARGLIGEDFVEVYVKCSVEECERRDPKGLYEQARNGEIENFTGISAPYEEPGDAEVVVDTEHTSLKQSVGAVYTRVF
jgi:adenylyl-sulfate kinase